MEDNGVCENTISGSEFLSKDLVVHTTLTQVQLNDSINISGGLINDAIHSVIDVIGVENYCRICGSQEDVDNLVNIFNDHGKQHELQKKIIDHLHLQVEKNDQLPQQVCNTCICHLNICQQLFEISHTTDCKLRQLFLLPQMSGSSSIVICPVDVMSDLETLPHHEENTVNNISMVRMMPRTEIKSFMNVRDQNSNIDKHDSEKAINNNLEDNGHEKVGMVPALEMKSFMNGPEQISADSNIGEYESDKTNNNNIENKEHAKVNKKIKTRSVVSLLCHICGKHFKNPTNLQSHKRTHLADSLKKKHICSLCPKSFRSKFHLSEHMNVHNGVTPYCCKECGKPFHKRAQLRQHLQIHTHDSKKVTCEVCGLRFNRRSNLQTHKKIHAENRTFECRLCLSQFPSFSAMLSHRKLHSQEDIRNRLSLDVVKNKGQIFSCEICGKILTNKHSLGSHLEKHKPENASSKFECPDCGKVLRSNRSLTYHQRSQHSGERPYHCSYCSEGFMTKKLQQAHERRHTGEKPFKCEICWRGFRSRNNLTQHMVKHNGEKKFECLVCNMKFSRKGALNVHNRKHTGEKPFICDLCGRPFTQKNDMLKHQKTHQEPNSRTCQLCMSVFSSKKELIKHKESAHKENINLIPLIITNNMLETHMKTENGQNIVFTTFEALNENNMAPPSTSVQ